MAYAWMLKGRADPKLTGMATGDGACFMDTDCEEYKDPRQHDDTTTVQEIALCVPEKLFITNGAERETTYSIGRCELCSRLDDTHCLKRPKLRVECREKLKWQYSMVSQAAAYSVGGLLVLISIATCVYGCCFHLKSDARAPGRLDHTFGNWLRTTKCGALIYTVLLLVPALDITGDLLWVFTYLDSPCSNNMMGYLTLILLAWSIRCQAIFLLMTWHGMAATPPNMFLCMLPFGTMLTREGRVPFYRLKCGAHKEESYVKNFFQGCQWLEPLVAMIWNEVLALIGTVFIPFRVVWNIVTDLALVCSSYPQSIETRLYSYLEAWTQSLPQLALQTYLFVTLTLEGSRSDALTGIYVLSAAGAFVSITTAFWRFCKSKELRAAKTSKASMRFHPQLKEDASRSSRKRHHSRSQTITTSATAPSHTTSDNYVEYKDPYTTPSVQYRALPQDNAAEFKDPM